ncbi:MAG: cytidylate kinase-like family protein [Lachnospiraceae bacterium]|nr:cytidylate kinase-like family protein [Lachnospiraceae bacterium]
MNHNEEMMRELAERIYDLDAEVYIQLGSSLGRVFDRDRERCVTEMMRLMLERDQSHVLRSQLALISNMARTISDRESRKMIMSEYNNILHDVIELPTSFGTGEILDQSRAELLEPNLKKHLKERFSNQDHLVICIGRTYGCGGSEIGFTLADSLKINYYDVEIFSEVIKRLEAEQDVIEDKAAFPSPYKKITGKDGTEEYVYQQRAFVPEQKNGIRTAFRNFNRYHGLSKRDAVYFNQSDLICDMSKNEDFVIMGRCADLILTNNHIPHISIFITAPVERRIRRIMEINKGMSEKEARRLVKKMDHKHRKYYGFYTGSKWGMPCNYDLCINSSSYGIEGSVELIRRMMEQE